MRSHAAFLECLFALQSEPSVAPLIWNPLGQTLAGDTAGNYMGHSVSLSADAKTLVIGIPGVVGSNSDRVGYVKVFSREDRNGSIWEPLGNPIFGKTVGDLFGYSVDVNSNGTIVVIGSPTDGPGYVQVYQLERSNDPRSSIWKRLGQDILGEANGDQFGIQVSLSGDGNKVAVAAWLHDHDDNDGYRLEDSGQVRVYNFENDGCTWEQIGQAINGESCYDKSGWSTRLSADGKTVAIGSWFNDNNAPDSGQVRVFQMDNIEGWIPLGQTLTGNTTLDNFGAGLDITSDGKILAIGAIGFFDDDRPGYVIVYRLENSADEGLIWMPLGQKIFGEANGDELGISVSLSSDGNVLAVGGWHNDGYNEEMSGHVKVYQLNNDVSIWEKVGEDIDGEAAGDLSGFSVSLSGDGKSVAIGSFGNDDNGTDSGHVRVFAMN